MESPAPAAPPAPPPPDRAPPIVSAPPSTRSPAGSRTRTCPHAAGCIDTPLFMRSSDGLGADDAHRLGRLSRANGDVATHVAVAVARADHGVAPGLELDVAPGEGAEGADARYRNLGEAVGEQREVHRLVEFRQQRAEARDLAAQHRTRRRLNLRRLQEREGRAAHLGRRQTVRTIDERLERLSELQPCRRPGLALLGEGERAVLTQHRLVQPQRLAPVLSGLEGLAARALRGIGTLARDRVDAPQPLGGFGPVRTQAARPEERGTRLLEASGPERCEPLARRPRVPVVAPRGVHAGEPGAGLGILRVDRQRPRVVLRGARILALGLCVLGIGGSRENARELSGARLAYRRSRGWAGRW